LEKLGIQPNCTLIAPVAMASVRKTNLPVATWTARFRDWLDVHGLLTHPKNQPVEEGQILY
jgi:hypothetical protein